MGQGAHCLTNQGSVILTTSAALLLPQAKKRDQRGAKLWLA